MVTVDGPPGTLLRWVWNRKGGGATVEGPPEAVEALRRCITISTQ